MIVGDDDAREHGGILDEGRVNRLRYLEGTPKGSTRWIDTGWALAAWSVARRLVREPVAADTAPARVRGADGRPLDAIFRVDRVGDTVTVVVESRGGTRGSSAERNVDYSAGLEQILQRIGTAGLQILDVLVESRDTAGLPPERRRVLVEGQPFPLVVRDVAALRQKISAAQARVGRAEGARGGGNRTKRLRIFLGGAGADAALGPLVRHLSGDERP